MNTWRDCLNMKDALKTALKETGLWKKGKFSNTGERLKVNVSK